MESRFVYERHSEEKLDLGLEHGKYCGLEPQKGQRIDTSEIILVKLASLLHLEKGSILVRLIKSLPHLMDPGFLPGKHNKNPIQATCTKIPFNAFL